MRAVAALLVAGLLTGCTGASYFPPSLFEVGRPCDRGDGWTGQVVMDDFRSDWYSAHLRAAREPRLGGEAPYHSVGGIGVLRFTWLRSFDAPVMVRVEATADDSLRLTATELSGAGGYGPGRVARRAERLLSADEAQRLLAMLDGTGILEPPRVCPPSDIEDVLVYADGAHWIIEANGPGGYRFVDHHSPRSGPVHDLGLHLLGLTGWTYDRVY